MSKRALLFPGQGAQAVGMGKELAELDPSIRALFDEASEILGRDLAAICFEGPREELTKSNNAQPAIFVVSVAAFRALELQGEIPFDAVAGLSSGEWAALHVAGAVSFADTIKLLDARGRFMQEACEQQPGGMCSVIGLDPEACAQIAEQAGIEVANYNSSAQTVLSGNLDGVDKAAELAREGGAKMAVKLEVSGAFHSSLMQSAADQFAEAVAEITFSAPKVAVLSNVTGDPHGDAAHLGASMASQITRSVQWVKNVTWMQEQGVSEYIECGPGKVLTGLVKRIDKTASLHNIQTAADVEKVRQNLA